MKDVSGRKRNAEEGWMEGGREGGREGQRERGREGGREGGRDRGREEGKKRNEEGSGRITHLQALVQPSRCRQHGTRPHTGTQLAQRCALPRHS